MSALLLQPPFLLSERDDALACELFEQVFKHPTSLAQWRWKYLEGPRLGGVHVGIKSANGKLVAHAGASVFEGQYKDAQGLTKRLPMAQVCDVMVHESARDGVTHQGAYAQVIHALQESLAQTYAGVYAYGFAGIRPYKLGLKMGMYKCHQDCRMGQLKLMQAPITEAPLRTQQIQTKQFQIEPLHIEPSEFIKHHAKFDEWAHAWGTTDAPKILRTGAYLQWRFVQNPNARYQFWLYSQDGQTKAWFVTRAFSPGHLTVVDALMHPSLHPNLQPHAAQAMYQPHLFNQVLNQGFHEGNSQTQLVSSWYIQTEDSLTLEPIKACEVRVGEWHACKPPQFWPADTDVF